MAKEADARAEDRAKRGHIIVIDPGISGTGVAQFQYFEKRDAWITRPYSVYRLKPPPKDFEWQEKVFWYTERLRLRTCRLILPPEAWLEMPEEWASSAKSQAAALQGNTFKLAYLVGAFAQMLFQQWNITANLLYPHVWTGQMDKATVQNRLQRALGKKYGNHTSDAVGMGMYLQGWDNVKFWKKVKEGKVR